jgi:hypothetical protein
MSLFIAVASPDGIAVSTDTRGTVPSPVPDAAERELVACTNGCRLPVSDTLNKLWTVADRIALGFYGEYSEGAFHVVRRVADAGPYTEPFELIEWVAAGLNKHDTNRGLQVVVAGYDQTWRPWLLGTRRREPGAPLEIVNINAEQPYGVALAGTFNAIGACLNGSSGLCANWMSAQDAIDASRSLIWVETTLRRFMLQTPVVGAAIETLFLHRGRGLEWLSRQTLHASEPGPRSVSPALLSVSDIGPASECR